MWNFFPITLSSWLVWVVFTQDPPTGMFTGNIQSITNIGKNWWVVPSASTNFNKSRQAAVKTFGWYHTNSVLGTTRKATQLLTKNAQNIAPKSNACYYFQKKQHIEHPIVNNYFMNQKFTLNKTSFTCVSSTLLYVVWMLLPPTSKY